MQFNIIFVILSVLTHDAVARLAGLFTKYNAKSEKSNQSSDSELNENEDRFGNEDKYLNTSQLIAKYGHPVEEHTVTTEDGYILNLVRIRRPGPVVFIFHCMLCSTDELVTNGPHTALPYLLSNASYDIWLGNARGNKYSRRHVRLSPEDRRFWEFSWHEIGYYDLPAMIDYALAASKQSQLVYIGHSQGTTTFLVLCSERPEYNEKISMAFFLSAVAYTWHALAPAMQILAPFQKLADAASYSTELNEIFSSESWEIVSSVLCDISSKVRLACATLLFSIFGFDYQQLETDQLSVQLAHFPAGGSIRQLLHYFQNFNTKKFGKYDHGWRRNLKLYGSLKPPSYFVGRITVPISIFYSTNDFLSNFEDVKIIIAELPNVVDVYQVPLPHFNHLDYWWAKDAKELVYLRILAKIDKLFAN